MSLDDAAIKQAFDELDADSSGSLDRSEVATLAKSLNKPLTEVELDVAMKQLDTDGSGAVSFSEFKTFWRQKFGGQIVEGTKLAAIMAQWSDLKPLPGVAYHPDRYVDPDDEFRARVWATFEKIDSNGDQEISYIEFINWWKRQDKAAHGGVVTISDEVLMTTRAKFREFDTNESNAIDRDELAGLLRALNLEKYVESVEAIEAENGPPPMAPTSASVKNTTDDPIVETDLSARAPDSMFSNLLKKGTNAVLPPNTQLGVDGHVWEVKDAVLTKAGISWSNPGKLDGPIPLSNIKRAETCGVPEDKGFGLKISLNNPDTKQSEWVFAVADEDDRDEWIASLKMIMLQELNPKAKRQSKAEERAKAKGKSAAYDPVGSKKTVLAEKVIKEQVQQAFSKFDADGSGTLDTSEIGSIATAVGKTFSQQELDAMCAELDKDSSGTVDYAEFEAWWLKTFSGELVEGSNLAAVMAAWTDIEHIDGVAYHPDRYVDPDDEFRARVWYVFDEIDSNHDRHLSYIEFINWWKKKDKEVNHGTSTISDDTLQETREKFNAYDSNGNGTIDRDELAGLLRALDLVAFIPEIEDLVDDDSYKVVVHTASHKEAGTDSKVSMTLYGENGDSGQRVLTTARNATFERGQISTLRITSTDLGKLTKCKIGHDNSGTEGGMPGKGWYLDKIVVSRTGMEPVTFAADRWLDTVNASDKQCEVTLAPGLLAKKKEKKVQKEDKIMYINPVYGPGGDIEAADAQEKLDPLGNPNRRITIIGADDLINADLFDKSDPYCVVLWNDGKGKAKRVGKTSTIDNTTYPRWNEDFIIQLPESGEGILRCELYDHDMFGGDDPLGSVEIKLGGPSNRRALLQTANYEFPDEKYSGFLTLKVDHAASRFASENAHEFKDKWMKGMTYREHREKHVFEEWTRWYIMGASGVLALFALLMFIYAVGLATCEANNSGYLSAMYVVMSPFAFLSGITGLYGAFRVKQDVEDEIGLSGGGDAEGDEGEDDGLQTTGQRILEFYNMCCVLIFVTLTIIIAETMVLENEEAANDVGCDDALGTLDFLMYASMFCLILLAVLVYANTLIVSVFEVLQTMAEFLALFLVLMGIFISVVSSFVVKQTICLDISSADGWPDEAYIFLVLGIFGMLTVAASFLGFVAAYQESMQYLLFHAAALGFLAVYGFAAIAYAGSTSATQFITGENCKPMLTTLSEDFLWETFGAVKYDGRGMSRNQSDPNLSWMPVRGPAEAPSCSPKTLTQFYWEDNRNNEAYIDSLSGQVYDESGVKVLYGCLNEPRACEHIAYKMSAYDMSIFVATFWLMLIIVGSIASSLWLRKETSMVGHILIHHHAKVVFWVMKISLLACMIILPFMFTGGECGTPQPATAPPLESSLDVVKVAVEPFSSCFDEILNGDETDVDCGGSCRAICRTFQGCKVTADCCTDPNSCDIVCAGREPLSPFCFDSRCIDGQATLLNGTFLTGTCRDGSLATGLDSMCQNGLVGVCVDRLADLCNNNEQDQDEGETGVDCGGPCNEKCSAGSGCLLDNDCSAGLFCGSSSNECYSCSDGNQNGDETDVDCGGSGCPRCPSDTSCSNLGCMCSRDDDCESSSCYSDSSSAHSYCVSSTNDRQDGDESGIDCGGSVAPQCSNGQCCSDSDDCISGSCEPAPLGVTCDTGNVCKAVVNSAGAAATCADGARNFEETGQDCGGYECRSEGRLCPVATCTQEEGGGIQCPVDTTNEIIAGQGEQTTCEINEDCVSGLCASPDDTGLSSGGVSERFCFSCSNGIRDGDETAIDCGNRYCGPCLDGTRCTADNQCMGASACITADPTAGWGVCASRHNNVVDGGETGFDCGGQAAQEGRLCGTDQGCNRNGDCLTGYCDLGADLSATLDATGYTLQNAIYVADASYWNVAIGGSCAINASLSIERSCNDHILNGDETDEDCGGLCALQGLTCDDGLRCASDNDCSSGRCGSRGTCVSCTNQVRDGDETDIDCGGSCGSCEEGRQCSTSDDCSSGICAGQSGELECASCSNRVRDGDETGIDCGGSCASRCPIRQCMSDASRCGLTEFGLSAEQRTCSQLFQLDIAREQGQPTGLESCVFTSCNVDSDCQTGYCDPDRNRCAPRTPDMLCQDGEVTVTEMHRETDIDCGAVCAVHGYRCSGGETCVNPSDCRSGSCVDGTCAGQCDDGVRNGAETDVDCGGECGQCGDGQGCLAAYDCVTNSCYGSDEAALTLGNCTSCFNGIKDGDEVGEDCGGSCDLYLCPLGRSCTQDVDCHSNNCDNGICASQVLLDATMPCADNSISEGEADVDCGGDCLQYDMQCSSGQSCFNDDDCESSICLDTNTLANQASDFRCVSCSDGVQNGYETDVDCGGRDCIPCSAAVVTDTPCASTSDCDATLPAAQTCAEDVCVSRGRMCQVDDDCGSGSCECENEQCTYMRCVSCFDGWRNGAESDTDCGGQCNRLCSYCEDGSDPDCVDDSCIADSDCNSGYCRRTNFAEEYGTCAAIPIDQTDLLGSCANGQQDSTGDWYESDVDCGGDCRNVGLLCADGSSCSSGPDCTSGKCSSSGECVSCSVCGSECALCADGETCSGDDDCVSGRCTNVQVAGVQMMKCTSCNDNRLQTPFETDVDCGGDATAGGCSRRCAVGFGCEFDSDCTTGSCTDNVCTVSSPSDTCSNAVQDGSETDMNCGGVACVSLGNQCAIGQGCVEDSDCLSATCDSATATCVSCTDGNQNGQETDVDCGGNVCSPCVAAGGDCGNALDPTSCTQLAQSCGSDRDCVTNTCYKRDSNSAVGVCVSTTNGVRDGREGGPDCGFHADSLCAVSQECTIGPDCSTGTCDSAVCTSPPPPPANAQCADGTLEGEQNLAGTGLCRLSCENDVQDGTETDVDCGGDFCRSAGYACSAGSAGVLPDNCIVPADCGSGACSLQVEGLQCDSTSDCTHAHGMPNTECYMPAPRWGYCDAAPFADCSDDSRCTTGTCIRYPGECIGTCSSCSDGRMNGAETDIDCGGGAGGCEGCSVGQSCSCGISSLGRCYIHTDCSGGLLCYAPLPDDGLPSGSDLPRALSAAQDAAVCIRPADINAGAINETVISSPGSTLLRKMSITGSAPSGTENPCTVTATVSASAGVRVAMQNYATRLAALPQCTSTSVTSTASGQTQIVGPYACVDKVLSEVRVDTTCDSVWIDGTTPEEDRVETTIMVRVSSTDAACVVNTNAAQLSVQLFGRPVLTVTGVAINGDCIDTDACDERSDLALTGVLVQGSVESCGDGSELVASNEVDCSAVPHPAGLPGGCCDAAEPFTMAGHVKTCPQLLAMGWQCTMATAMINMPLVCADTCNLCPPAPPPPPPLSTETPTVAVDAADTGLTSQGKFTLRIPLGMSGASDGSVFLTLSVDGYEDTKVVLPVMNGNIDAGHIVMVAVRGTDENEIQGSCVDLYSTDAQKNAFADSGTDMTATLYEGQVIYPAQPEDAYPISSTPSAGSEVSRGQAYRFTDVPRGTYTVVCQAGGIRAVRYVYSAETMRTMSDAVAMPTAYAASADGIGGVLSGGEILVSVDWQVMGDRDPDRDSDSQQLGRPDLDINGMFQATEAEACHIFFDYPRCGDVELLPDFRAASAAATPLQFWETCGNDPLACDILDGPTTHDGVLTVPTEAIIIRQVRGAIYTFYVQYSNANLPDTDLLYRGVDPSDFLDETTNRYFRVVEVNADVFAGDSRIAHTVGTFEVPGNTPYMRLFCIDATSGAPKVFSAVMMSDTPPEMCTSCPC